MKKDSIKNNPGDIAAINDELFLALFKKAAHEFIEHDLIENIESLEKFTPSPEFDEKMKGIISKAIRNEKRAKSRKVLLKVTAGFGIFLVLSTAVIFSAEALRVKVLNFFINANDSMASIDFIKNGIVRHDTLPCIPGYMTEGFDLTSVEDLLNMYIYTYENNEGKAFSISVYTGNPSILIDTEDAEHGNLTISGQEAYYSLSDGVTTIVFRDDKYVYLLTGDIPIDEALKIAENLN